jgi:flagellar protein FlgJ
MGLPSTSASGGVDPRNLDSLRDPTGSALRARASADPKAVIQQAAKQFEALFMQQLMKSMRDATLSSGMLENGGTQLGTDMLDQQYANQMTGLKGGLSDAIVRQLERQMNGTSAPTTAKAANVAIAPGAAAGAPSGGAPRTSVAQGAFLRTHTEAARAAEAATGIPAAFMVAQAAHESGWGKREIKNADGSSSHNVFGIKAGANWTGPTATVTTTEYVDGQPRKVQAKFRAYASYEESFKDYAQMMKDSPRYAKVVASGSSADGFARGLQNAGYATDPQYAQKLTRVINTTLRWQQAALNNSRGNLA